MKIKAAVLYEQCKTLPFEKSVPLIVQEIYSIMRQIREQEGTSMLLVEQNANIALNLADHAYLLETGSVVMSDESHIIRDDENVRRSYLGY